MLRIEARLRSSPPNALLLGMMGGMEITDVEEERVSRAFELLLDSWPLIVGRDPYAGSYLKGRILHITLDCWAKRVRHAWSRV